MHPRTASAWRTATAALSVVAFLSACAPGAPPAAPTSAPAPKPTVAPVATAPSKPPAAAVAVPTAQPTAAAAAKPQAAARTPELVVDAGVDPILNLDPIMWRSTLEKTVQRLTYESLVTYDRDMQIQPRLATSWTLADDRMTWTFQLRPGVKFHDGTPFNAAAAKFNIDRMIDPKSLSLNGPTYGTTFESATAVDDLTLVIKTKGSQSATLGALAGWGGEMASPTAVQGMGEDFNAKGGVGTGPYVVESFTPRSVLSFKRNEEYWGDKGVADKITVRTIPEVSARVAAISSGQTHLALGMQANQLATVRANPNLNVVSSSPVFMEYLGLNTQRAPLDKKEVRQAIAYAIDMPAIVRDVYDGQLVTYAGPIPPPIFGHDSSIKQYALDLDKARALLKEAGVEEPTLELWYSDRPDLARFTQLLQTQLKAVGINTNIQRMEYATFYAALGRGEGQIFLQGWGNSTGDPYPTMNSLFNSFAPPTVNLTGYKNPEVDTLLGEIRSEMDPEKRKALLSRAATVINDDAPMPFFWSPISNAVVSRRVQGFEPAPIGDYTTLVGVGLAN